MTTVADTRTHARASAEAPSGVVRRAHSAPHWPWSSSCSSGWSRPSALLISSFRPASERRHHGWWTAFSSAVHFTLDNYPTSSATDNIGQTFLNSLFITIPATVIPIMVAAFAAYAFAWMEFPGRNILFILVVALLVVPLQSTLIPVLQARRPRSG